MHTIVIQQAMQSLPELIQETLDNSEETVIVSEVGAVVLVAQREWENMLEMVRLLQDKTSLRALLDGHKDRELGNTPDAVTVAEAFYDLHVMCKHIVVCFAESTL